MIDDGAGQNSWQQYDRLAGTSCACGHTFDNHGASTSSTVCWVSGCECRDAVTVAEQLDMAQSGAEFGHVILGLFKTLEKLNDNEPR